MADNDPFANPDDSEKTVIKPNPGGRRTMQPAQPAAAPQPGPADIPAPAQGGGQGFGVPPASSQPQAAAAAPRSSGGADANVAAQSMTGMNQLNACGSTLFSLVSRIRNRAQHMDPDKLRQSVVAEVRAFENRALQAGIDAQQVKIARYAICATLDDVVLNTPWGGQSVWAQQSMVGTFHRETVGGDRFFDLLARLEADPGNNTDLLEFLFMCLSLGFEGRLRVEQGGGDKHMQIRTGLARIIRGQRGAVEWDVSPHWQGLDRPHKALSAWRPVWIAVSVTLLLLAGGFMALSYVLGGSTERLLGQLSVLDSGIPAALERRAPPPPPPLPVLLVDSQIETVTGFLEQEITEGIVEVFQDANTITVRIAGSGMFGSGSDHLEDAFDVPLARVARALNEQSGPVIVVGHSDNVPIRSSRFPSNLHLSLARAQSVMKTIAAQIDDPGRLTAEGRAEKDPIAPNNTRAGRAKNRRIEIVLIRAGSQ
ncbi:type VI secretion system protein TssL, long form [Candidatus Halocynthiibacter alkanivorans]|jgi:type VI secretion system protein ImpK|uniref:type VI secretion system protein TssL, long form n=1 Tax=Candidatus Halocynthiibacter alkanivorans TaxID=2267619 RepID=UPI000DF4A2A4|nr:type VI secretion system protein TssL, long form [Candidatus Halocynthiibacter alkanivorans]